MRESISGVLSHQVGESLGQKTKTLVKISMSERRGHYYGLKAPKGKGRDYGLRPTQGEGAVTMGLDNPHQGEGLTMGLTSQGKGAVTIGLTLPGGRGVTMGLALPSRTKRASPRGSGLGYSSAKAGKGRSGVHDHPGPQPAPSPLAYRKPSPSPTAPRLQKLNTTTLAHLPSTC